MAKRPASIHASGVNILLAEDDPAFRGLLRDALRQDGHWVDDVAGGRDFLEALREYCGREEQLGLVICDQRLPEMTALDALERATGGTCAFPVLLMTSQADEATLARAARLNVVAVFRAPFDLDDLRTAVFCLSDGEPRGGVLSRDA